MNFIKRVLSTITGIFVFFFICFFFLFLIGIAMGSSSKEKVQVKSNSVLNLKLDFPIKDFQGKIRFKEYPFLDDNKKTGLFNIIDAINYAANDPKIKGISLDNNIVRAGISQVKAIRDALLKFKESGKFITAYGDFYTQKDYYLSSVADTIYINPSGAFEYKGLYSENLYFKEFQEKTGIKMEVIKIGKYKSAAEPFLSNNMSDENREQIKVFLNGIWTEINNEIAESRALTPEKLNAIATNLSARNPSLALESKLVDKLVYYDEYIAALKRATGTDEDDKLNTIGIKAYAKHAATKKTIKDTKDKIAVIYAEGQIMYGEGDETYIGQESINKSFQKARKDDKVKAIVLRVNSPGGSALASELIWREVARTKNVKPIIVSMGNLAASGGYYISCNADKIVAEPTTITGSIGVVGMVPNIKDLSDDMGINAEQVKTHENAITYSPFETFNATQKGFIAEEITHIYKLFKNRVAEGRKMSLDAVEEIAQGRVWTGTDALEKGLVDELGGLDRALELAAEAADIESYNIKEFPVFEKDLKKIFEDLGLAETKETLLREELGEEAYTILKKIKALSQQKGVQLIFPYDVEIK